jgi:hypothetical protein
MKYKVEKIYRDKDTKVVMNPGVITEYPAKRGEELVKRGFLKAIEEEKVVIEEEPKEPKKPSKKETPKKTEKKVDK